MPNYSLLSKILTGGQWNERMGTSCWSICDSLSNTKSWKDLGTRCNRASVGHCLILLLLLLTYPLFAQTAESELSIEEKVDQVFASFDSTNSPGCAVSVIQDGNIVYKQGYGMANLDHDVPIRTDTVFHVASVSKEFTAASIALLALEGKLSLDDPVQKYLPWLPHFNHRITIRNLVHHNSGIRDQWTLLGMSGWRYSRDLISDEDVIYLLEKQRDLNFEPGERYLYSNSGYTLMSLIVQKVSGKTLREFTTEHIFRPLGMDRTHFRDNFSEIVKDQAYGYRRNNDRDTFELSVTNFNTVGATSLLTTVKDMARWDRNFIEPRVGGQAFLDLIHQRGVLNSGEQQTYAFGLTYGVYRGLPTVGHGGSDAGYRSNFVRFPEKGYSFVVLCNLAQTNPGRLARNVADIYLADSLAPPESDDAAAEEVELSDGELARIEGAYWSDSFASAIEVSRGDEGNIAARIGRNTHRIVFTGDGRFEIRSLGAVARFEPAGGSVDKIVLRGLEDGALREEGVRLKPFDTSGTGLEEFAGEYESPELPIPYFITLEDDRLTFHALKRNPIELRPVAQDHLAGDGAGSLRFERNSSGEITGFILDSGRVRNFRFKRTTRR